MPVCPTCGGRLARYPTATGVIHPCPKCSGRAVAFGVLRRQKIAPEFLRLLDQRSRYTMNTKGKRCPHCRRAMTVVDIPTPGGTLELDVCKPCRLVWFDPSEFARPPRAVTPAIPPRQDPGEPAEAVAKAQPKMPQAPNDHVKLWHWLPGILGLPVELGAAHVRHRPYLTWAVALIAVVAFLRLAAGNALGAAIAEWGFLADDPLRHGGMTLVTSFFLHVGLWHLIGNMYFLLIFADNVEDHLGRAKFLALLAASHAAGLALHGAYDPRGGLPCVGASAGIAGVIAYYAVVFPHVRIGLLFFWFLWLRISAVTALVCFVLLQLFGAYMQTRGLTSVSALAHLGGLAVGLAAGFLSRSFRARPLAAR